MRNNPPCRQIDVPLLTGFSHDRPRCALGDEHDRSVGVARSDGGHRRSIDHSKAGGAIHAAVGVEHCGGRARPTMCVKGSHRAGAHRVENSCTEFTSRILQLFVAQQFWAGKQLLGAVGI